jgi:hypothetical protein
VKERVIAEEAHRETDFGAGKNSSSAFYTAHKRAKFGLASEKNYAFVMLQFECQQKEREREISSFHDL